MLGCAALLALAGCAEQRAELQARLEKPGYLGRLIDVPAPQVATREGGPTGVLISGPYVSDISGAAVDHVVAAGLHDWLTFEERRSLAVASQRAAVSVTGTAVAWSARDGSNATTAAGSVIPVGDPFRSLRGSICRDVRQNFAKGGEPRAESVTLCRATNETGITLWTVADVD